MHEGQWLRSQISSRFRIKDFADKAGVSPEVLRKYFLMPRVHARPNYLRAIFQLLGVPDSELRVALRNQFETSLSVGKSAAVTLGTEDPLVRAMIDNSIRYLHPGEFDENVTPITGMMVDIPTFDLPLSASRWVDVDDIPEIRDPRVIAQGLFRVRLHGDCMTPKYKDGSTVEFRVIPLDDVRAGMNCYLQTSDGRATFKHVQQVGDDAWTLTALNKKKYPEPMTVERAMIVRAAKAVGEFRPEE